MKDLIRFSAEPSSLKRLEILLNQYPEEKIIEMLELELKLEPRSSDNGKISYWEAQRKSNEEDYILAAFAAKREKRDKLAFMGLSKEIFETLNLEVISEEEEDTFDCVKALHRVINLKDEEIRTKLATEIFKLRKNKSDSIRFDAKKKGEIVDFIKGVYMNCQNSNKNIQKETEKKASGWIQEELLKRSSY